MADPKVLVVEDEKNIRTIIAEVLEWSSQKFQVDMAEDGKACLSYLQKGTYDIILLDLVMPCMSGIEVMDYMRKENINIPVLVVTGCAGKDIVKEAKEKSDGFLEKPFDYTKLPQIIFETIQAKKRK